MFFNTTTDQTETYSGTAWTSGAGGVIVDDPFAGGSVIITDYVPYNSTVVHHSTVAGFTLGLGGKKGQTFTVVNDTTTDCVISRAVGVTTKGEFGTAPTQLIVAEKAVSFVCVADDSWFLAGQAEGV